MMDLYQLKIMPSQWDARVFNIIHYVHILRPVHSMFLRTKLWADPRKDKNNFAMLICLKRSTAYFTSLRDRR